MRLSIVIPAHNIEHRLLKTLQDYAVFFSERFGRDVEIIVVAKHCADNTESVARNAADIPPQIRVIAEPKRIGKGGAVRLGMPMAQGEFMGFVDADDSTAPKLFLELLENIGRAECIIGSRWIDGAVVSPQQSWMRRMASRVLNRLVVHRLFGLDVKDSQCGAKVFRQDVLQSILPQATELGWAFDVELLCRVKKKRI